MSGPNLGRVASYNSYEGNHYAIVQAFNGRTELSVWNKIPAKEGKRGPIIKILFTSASLYLFKRLLTKCLDDDQIKPTELGFAPFDRETSSNVFRGAITIGRDQEGRIYLEVVGDQHKEPVRLKLIETNAVRLNGNEIPDKQATELTVGSLIDQINNVLQFGTYFTMRDNRSTTPQVDNTSSGGDITGDDVNF